MTSVASGYAERKLWVWFTAILVTNRPEFDYSEQS